MTEGIIRYLILTSLFAGLAACDVGAQSDAIPYPLQGQIKQGKATCHRAGTWIDTLADKGEKDVPKNADYTKLWYREDPAWAEEGTTIYATNLARAEWELKPSAAGMYKFGFCHFNHGGTPPAGYKYRLHFLVDHIKIQTLEVEAAARTSAWHYVTTPWLTATNHRFRLVWMNWLAGKNTSLGVKEVGLFGVKGARKSPKARMDWEDEILAQGKDTDGDGLSDESEIDIHRTDPLNPDTDGDHLLDGDEVNKFGLDPNKSSTAGNSVRDTEIVVKHDGVDTVSRIDAAEWYWAWWRLDSSLVAKGKDGTLTYSMPVKKPGIYRIGLQIKGWDCEVPDDWKYKVEVYLNRKLLKTLDIVADHDFSGTGYVDTDQMDTGNHQVTLKWINSAWEFSPTLRSPNIQVENVCVYGINGPDRDGNGVPDWQEKVAGGRQELQKLVAQELGYDIFDRRAKHQKVLELVTLKCDLKDYDEIDATLMELLFDDPSAEVADKAEKLKERARKEKDALDGRMVQLKQASEKNPKDVAGIMALGKAYEDNKALGTALKYYQSASALKPETAVFTAIGRTYAALYRQAVAMDKMRKQLADFTKEKQEEYLKKAQKEADGAMRIAEMRKRLEKTPANAGAWRELARALLEMKKDEQAVQAYVSAIKHGVAGGNVVEAWKKELQEVFDAHRKDKTIMAFYRGLIERDPKVEYYDGLIRTLDAGKEPDMVVAVCLEFFKKFPDQKVEYEKFLNRAYDAIRQRNKAASPIKPPSKMIEGDFIE